MMLKKLSFLLLLVFAVLMVPAAFGQDVEAEKIQSYIKKLEEKMDLAKKAKDKKKALKIEEMIKEQSVRLKSAAEKEKQKAAETASAVSEDKINELVAKALAKKAPAPSPISGTFYIRYIKGLSNSPVVNNFDIDRAYLTFKNNLGDNAAYSVTLDSARTNGMMYTFLKYAYVDLNNVAAMEDNKLNIRIGLQPTFWSPWVDSYLGMRVVASSMVGLDGGVTTGDFGVGGLGKINIGGVSANYLLTALNGSGYTAIEGNAGKNVAFRVDSEVTPGVTIGLGGQIENVGSSSTGGKLATALAGYKCKYGKTYFELMYGKGTLGYSLAGNYDLGTFQEALKNYGVFGRVDIYDPNRSVDNDGLTRLWTGVTYDWNKNVKLIADYDAVSYASAAAANAGKTVSQVALRTQIVL